MKEESKVITLLASLRDKYEALVTALETLDTFNVKNWDTQASIVGVTNMPPQGRQGKQQQQQLSVAAENLEDVTQLICLIMHIFILLFAFQ